MRTRTLCVTGLLAGGLLGLVAGSQAWWHAVGSGVFVSITGSQATGGLTTALAAAVLAGVLLVLTLGARASRAVGVLLVLTGLGMVVTGVSRARPTPATVRDRMAVMTLAQSFALHPTVWAWVYGAAGAVVVGSGVVLVLRAAHWPVRTARFDRAGSGPAADFGEDPARVWRALDAGLDPTLSDGQTSPPADAPDARSEGRGETMKGIGT